MADSNHVPLAERIRPKSLDHFVGQEHLVGPGGILRKLLQSDQLVSLILWGPPGSGKTTLAHIIAEATASHFLLYSAVEAKIEDVRKVVAEAKERLSAYNQRTILFIDEIHRFNKAQQDAFLPRVEKGDIVLIGATTENPSFEIIGPLLSRCRVLILNPLTETELSQIITRGEKELGVALDQKARGFLIESANGDARIVLNILEIAHKVSSKSKQFSLQLIEEAAQKKSLLYDRAGEEHYNTISAFIKSLRGSDPDAAVYWMARMLEAGEDPLFITRRMVIFASEDIGNADPQALSVAVAAKEAVDFVGLPEAKINLAQAATYLATAPKSNAAYAALLSAEADVKKTLNQPVPLKLRNPVTNLMKQVGYGRGYRYPHAEPGHLAQGETYLPEKLMGRKYYRPSAQGKEKEIRERIAKIRR